MKYNLSNKVIFKTKVNPYSVDGRYVLYKIEPSELNWFKRTFCNPWREMFRAYYNFPGFCNLFDVNQFSKYIAPLKTFGDVSDYLASQIDIEKRIREELDLKWLNAKEIW